MFAYRISLRINVARAALILFSVAAFAILLCTPAIAQGETDRSAEAVALFNSGQDAHEKGDLSTAIQSYEKALKLIPEFPEAELQRGTAYQSLGKLDEAEAAFRRAVLLREDWSLGLANLGSVLVRKRKFGEAETYLAKAIELDELNFPAYAAMTEVRLQTKADVKVLTALLARITVLTAKANPTASIWASRAALEVAVGDRKSAKASAARALQLDPKSQFGLSTSANIAIAENDPSAADVFVRKLEILAPRSEPVLGLRARILAAQGKASEALALLNSISGPLPETIELKNLIVAASSTNTAELEQQLAGDPMNTLLLARLCGAYRVSDPAKALDYCRRA